MKTTDFNFDRCLKFVFTGGTLGEYYDADLKKMVENKFIVEYNPKKASFLCPRLEATVVGTPYDSMKGRPGTECYLKIYNPSNEILNQISAGSVNMSDFDDAREYYKHKLNVTVYAGYHREPEKPEEKKKEENKQKTDNIVVEEKKDNSDKNEYLLNDTATYGPSIFSGYVNNSFLVHNSTDNILTLACHDIDLANNQFNQIKAKLAGKEADVSMSSKEMEDKRLKPDTDTFHQTLLWLIAHFTGIDGVYSTKDSIAKAIAGAWNAVMNLISGGIRIYYVKDPSRFLEAMNEDRVFATIDSLLKEKQELFDTELEKAAKSKDGLRVKNFYSLKSNLNDVIRDLCEFTGARIACKTFKMFGKDIYCIYRMSNRQNTVDKKTKGIVKIYNFQNLLDTPTVAPNGSMTVNMWFNRDCVCWKHIALILDSDIKGNFETNGLLNINKLNFTSNDNGQFIVPIGGTADNAMVTTNQLSTNMAVSAAAKYKDVAVKNGYMFNVGFLITKVTHKLSTHSKDWSTTVQTVPMVYGDIS